MKKFTFIFLFILLTVVSVVKGSAINLSDWTPYSYNLTSQPAGNWVLGAGDTLVTQTVNADVTMFLNGVTQTNYNTEGTFRVTNTTDDDMIGFVFGFQDLSHFYLFQWKRGNQNQSGYGSALEGFTIRKLDAPSPDSLTAYDFWESSNTEYSTILASYYNTSIGWVSNSIYSFFLERTIDSSTVRVLNGIDTLWETTIYDNSYSYGQFGFYNHSQEDVEYVGFKQNSLHIQYVDTTGSDLTGDGTIANPFLTIQHAVNIAQDTDTISIGPGIYNESIFVDSKSLILFGRAGYENTIIDANLIGDAITIGPNGTQETVITGLSIIGGAEYNLNLYEGNAIIQNCVIDTAGKYSVCVHPQWINSVIDSSNDFILRLDDKYNAVLIGSESEMYSYISQSTQWPEPPFGFCYVLKNNMQISNSDAILDLLPNTVIKMNKGIQVIHGAINADGVLFTSFWDDTLGNSVNHEVGIAAPGQADGISIWYESNDQSSFSNCVFRFLGNVNDTTMINGALSLWKTVDITNCFFEQNANSGLFISGSNVNSLIDNCSFINNPSYGIENENGALPVIQNSTFEDNSLAAVQNNDVSIIIDARNNWWGSNIGPLDSTDAISGPPDYNKYGNGDKVSDYVNYRPWIGMTCCLGIRGNIDNDENDNIDIADLVYFVAYSFSGGPEPPCFNEADVDDSEELNIGDIVYLVDYMFGGGQLPVECP